MKIHKNHDKDGSNERGMVPLRNMMGRLFEESFLFPDFVDSFFNDQFFTNHLSPIRDVKVDIEENETEFLINAQLPGADPNKIDLDLTETSLTITAEVGDEKEEKNKNYIRRECSYGKVKRGFDFSHAPIMVDKASADFKNGVLKITLPKKKQEKLKGKKIPINA